MVVVLRALDLHKPELIIRYEQVLANNGKMCQKLLNRN